MSGGKKQQKYRRDSVENWRLHVLPPERSRRQFTTSVNPASLAAVPRGLRGIRKVGSVVDWFSEAFVLTCLAKLNDRTNKIGSLRPRNRTLQDPRVPTAPASLAVRRVT